MRIPFPPMYRVKKDFDIEHNENELENTLSNQFCGGSLFKRLLECLLHIK